MTTVTIGYWRLRGLAQPIRLLLAYTETPFQEVVYDFAEKQRWFDEDKKNIGFDFPNIPYLIDGDLKLTESSAIMKYLVKRSGKNELLGKNLQDEGSVESILGVENDILNEMRKLLAVKENLEIAKAEALAKIKPKLDALKKFVG